MRASWKTHRRTLPVSVMLFLLASTTCTVQPFRAGQNCAIGTLQTSLAARRTALFGSRDQPEDESVSSATAAYSGIPQLPAMGTSSFDPTNIAAPTNTTAEASTIAFVGHKFELQYTCKVCDTRNSHRVSRIAYRNGVVISVCKGCESKHLIADNLGWTDYEGGFQEDNTIEEYLESRGLDDHVNRVSPDVFELEKLLQHDGHSIVGQDGNPTME